MRINPTYMIVGSFLLLYCIVFLGLISYRKQFPLVDASLGYYSSSKEKVLEALRSTYAPECWYNEGTQREELLLNSDASQVRSIGVLGYLLIK